MKCPQTLISSYVNVVNRKKWSKSNIVEAIKEYKERNEKFWSPITQRLCPDYKSWYVSIVYHLDKPSSNHFFYLLEDPHFSKYSGKPLSELEFSYSETYKGWTGWKLYTREETKQKVWHKLKVYKPTAKQIANVSAGLQKFYKSPEGIQSKEIRSNRMKQFCQTAEGKQMMNDIGKKTSITLKSKIASGEYTPCITNTWTHWNAVIELENGSSKQFRSSWEACFYLCNPTLEYETIRVKGHNKTYINDFYNPQTKELFEIKPYNRYNKEIEKMTTLQQYCIDNGLKFIWLNEFNIQNYIDVSKFKTEKNKLQLTKLQKACKLLK